MSFFSEVGNWLQCQVNDTQYYGPIEAFKLVILNDDDDVQTHLGICSLERLPEMLHGLKDRGRFDLTRLTGFPIYRHYGLDEYLHYSFEVLEKRYC